MAAPEAATELAVLDPDRVEAVGAGSDDRLLAHPVAIERLDLRARQHLVDVVVAQPAARGAGAGFPLAEDGEVPPRRIEARREGPGDLAVPLVEGGRAA